MTTTIASGIHTTTPSLVKSWSSSQEARNVVHTIIGRSDPDITLKPAGKLFALPLVFVIDSTDETWLDGFRFVANGNISAVLDADDFTSWHISVDYQEVLG